MKSSLSQDLTRVLSSCLLRLVNVRVSSCCVWKNWSVRIGSIFVHNFFADYNYFIKERKQDVRRELFQYLYRYTRVFK